MDTVRDTSVTLHEIPASRRLVEDLAAAGLIADEVRNAALRMLHPGRNWGMWVARLLLVLGVSLVLSGAVYFFAFNWTKIPPLIKLGALEAAIACCIIASLFYGLQRLSGQVLTLCASVLTGVFLAVFGQIYQTGADAWQLFAIWTALIFPWVALTRLAALWAVWLAVANIALILCWEQEVLPAQEGKLLILPALALFNGIFLMLREYGVRQGREWLHGRWTRMILIIPIVVCALVPMLSYATGENLNDIAIKIGAPAGFLIHLAMYCTYRRYLPDMWPLAVLMLSACILIDTKIFDLLHGSRMHHAGVLMLMGGATIAIFGGAVVMLRRMAATMEDTHD